MSICIDLKFFDLSGSPLLAILNERLVCQRLFFLIPVSLFTRASFISPFSPLLLKAESWEESEIKDRICV